MTHDLRHKGGYIHGITVESTFETCEWQQIQSVRSEVRSVLGELPCCIRDAAVMTVSELLENAFKYGAEREAQPRVRFALRLEENILQIGVTNRLGAERDLERLCTSITSLGETEDPQRFYEEQLRTHRRQQGEASRLGLLRIRCEGLFTLSWRVDGEELTVMAVRGVP